MGVQHGLSVNGVKYFADLLKEEQGSGWTTCPDWMQFGKELGKMTGHYEILNFMTGMKNAEQIFLATPKWPIGGMYFDGIMRTEHTSRIRPTTYPVQTGVTMTDHAIIEPVELTIEVMMTDTTPTMTLQMGTGGVGGGIGGALGGLGGILTSGTGGGCFGVLGGVAGQAAASNAVMKSIYSSFGNLPCMPDLVAAPGDGRSVAAWQSLRALQLSRVPVTVETRLENYSNMLIEELSAPDDVKTLHALRCTVRLREIIFATVAEQKVSARAAASSEETTSGQTPTDTNSGLQKTGAAAIADKASEVAAAIG